MVAEAMVVRGASIRRVASQLGVTEGALRYRLQQRKTGPVRDGRAGKSTLVDGYEEAVEAILREYEDVRVTGSGRPAQARRVYEALAQDYEYRGSYRAVVRHLRRRYGLPPVRALRRVETPPGVQAQHDWFEEKVGVGGALCVLYFLVGVLSHSRARFCWVSRSCDQLAWSGSTISRRGWRAARGLRRAFRASEQFGLSNNSSQTVWSEPSKLATGRNTQPRRRGPRSSGPSRARPRWPRRAIDPSVVVVAVPTSRDKCARPAVPEEAVHPVRRKASTRSGACRPLGAKRRWSDQASLGRVDFGRA
jgi:transposase